MSVADGMAQPRRAPSVPPRLNSTKSSAGNGHPAHGCRDGQRGPARFAQVAGDELPLELQPGDEEEDREQAVGGPGAQRQVQVQGRRADAGVAEVS